MLITLGKCNRFYLYILGSAISKFFSLILLGINSNTNENGFGLFGFCPTFNKYNFTQSIFIYFGYIIFGIIFFFFLKLKSLDKKAINIRTITSSTVESFIYNDPNRNKHKKLFTHYTLISLAFVFYIEIKKVLYIEGFQFFNFWTVEIIFLLFLLKKYFIIDFYYHHKVSIIFIISACSALLLTASILPNSLLNKNYSENAYQNINDKLGSYFYCILIIILFVGLSFIYSYSRTYSKVLMQINFVSPFQIIFIFGIAGLPISIITSIVSSYLGYDDNLFNYFSSMNKMMTEKETYKFWVEIFCVYPLYSFTSFMELTCEMLTIYYLNPFYVLMTNNLYYEITELINFLPNVSNAGLKIAHFVVTEFSEIFASLGYMVYLEILELNFCELNDKLKFKLAEKGDIEFKKLTDRKTRQIYLDENDDESEK